MYFNDLPNRYSPVVQKLRNININHKIQIADLGEMERQEQQKIALRRALFSGNKAIDLENYHTYDEVRHVIDMYFSS